MSVLEQARKWPVEIVAVGVTSASQTLDTDGPADRAFPLASVTKPLVAYSVLVAVDQGHIDLDEPVDDRGATPRHLLAHAAGYPMDGTEPRTEPGTRRIYSNTGFERLGDLVQHRTGRPVTTWLHQQVLLPLGMHDTELDGSPASGATGTVHDLLAFARELMIPSLIDDDLLAEATSVQFPGLDGVLPGFGRQIPNDWGLGLEIKDAKRPHWTGSRQSPATFGHFGQAGSFLWVDPEARLAAACAGDGSFGEWAAETWPGFNDAVAGEFG